MDREIVKTKRTYDASSASGMALSAWCLEEWSIGDSDVWYENHQSPMRDDGKEFSYDVRKEIDAIVSELFDVHDRRYPGPSSVVTESTTLEHDCPAIFDLLRKT